MMTGCPCPCRIVVVATTPDAIAHVLASPSPTGEHGPDVWGPGIPSADDWRLWGVWHTGTVDAPTCVAWRDAMAGVTDVHVYHGDGDDWRGATGWVDVPMPPDLEGI